jgi:hypothetical protein
MGRFVEIPVRQKAPRIRFLRFPARGRLGKRHAVGETLLAEAAFYCWP